MDDGHLPILYALPIVYTVSGSGPLFALIVDYYLNGVKINSKQLWGIVVGLVGLILTINGRILITYIDPKYELET